MSEPALSPIESSTETHALPPRARFFRGLGPGLITGAADDDPSGISTYATAGAAFGYGMLWTALFSFPLMSSVQLMCARIGLVTGRGLASVLKHHYSRPLLWLACSLLLAANTVNIAADIAGMSQGAELLTGIPAAWFPVPFVGLMLGMMLFGSYRLIVRVFKWLTLVLFSYVIAAFLAQPDWGLVLRMTLLPSISFGPSTLTMFVAIMGTTISPYLFFWQAAQELEEERLAGKNTVELRLGASPAQIRHARTDVLTGMFFSNFIMYFIMLTTGATLHAAGVHEISTAREAALALRPLAGEGASALFALGLLGTGFLGVPVLAGSAAYAVSEAGAWRGGINHPPWAAKKFYLVLAVAMLAGLVLTLTGVDAIRMLFWAALLNGLLAPPLIIIILVICNDRTIMREYRNGPLLNALGGLTALVMTAAALGTLIGWVRG